MLVMAFEITEDDICSVLRQNWALVGNTKGLAFEAMATELLGRLDHDRIASAALKGGVDLDDQVSAAHAEIRAILVEQGVLKTRPIDDPTSRPLAAKGLTSYRCKGSFGWIMIGAVDHDDAMREARRSSPHVSPEGLQVWDRGQYVSCYPAKP